MLFEDNYLKYWEEDEKIKKIFYVSNNGGIVKYIFKGLYNIKIYQWVIV